MVQNFPNFPNFQISNFFNFKNSKRILKSAVLPASLMPFIKMNAIKLTKKDVDSTHIPTPKKSSPVQSTEATLSDFNLVFRVPSHINLSWSERLDRYSMFPSTA